MPQIQLTMILVTTILSTTTANNAIAQSANIKIIISEIAKEPLKRYVTSRIQYILDVSSPDQWHYIQTELNPADLGTRPITVKNLQASCWLSGPDFLFQQDPSPPESPTLQLPSASFFTHASSYFASVTCF